MWPIYGKCNLFWDESRVGERLRTLAGYWQGDEMDFLLRALLPVSFGLWSGIWPRSKVFTSEFASNNTVREKINGKKTRNFNYSNATKFFLVGFIIFHHIFICIIKIRKNPDTILKALSSIINQLIFFLIFIF